MAKPIGTLGNIPTLLVNGRTFVDLTNLIVLFSTVGTSGTYTTSRSANATSGYQVSGTLTVGSIDAAITDQPTGSQINLLYGDNDVGQNGSSPTNAVFCGGNSSNHVGTIFTGNKYILPGINFSIPNGKYPAFSATQQVCLLSLYGYLS